MASWIEKHGFIGDLHGGTGLNGDVELTTAPDAVVLRTPAQLQFDDEGVWGAVSVRKGERVPFVLTWHPADEPPPPPLDPSAALAAAERRWTEWSQRSSYRGDYQDAVNPSLITLKAMVYAPSGGIIAAPTTSLPESIGGVRNWDYRREAEALFERLLSLRNDLGLLSEEYEPRSGRLIGNVPQAFSHLALIHSASVLADEELTPRESTHGEARQPPAPHTG
jgi:GH15 family glucan-1,4-alpha-glucosidase